jgi:hypothetical protein
MRPVRVDDLRPDPGKQIAQLEDSPSERPLLKPEDTLAHTARVNAWPGNRYHRDLVTEAREVARPTLNVNVISPTNEAESHATLTASAIFSHT